MGIGVLIGTGIVCALAALCHAEFASTVPVAGSAYTFSYASMGEIIAWMIGWDLVLEFTLGAATVSKGWGGYFDTVMASIGLPVPEAISAGPGGGGIIDLPAVAIALLMMTVLIIGIKLSAWVNATVTTLKLAPQRGEDQ